MSQLNKTQLEAENQSSFPNNNVGAITPTLLRGFNTDMIDSMTTEGEFQSVSQSLAAEVDSLQSQINTLIVSGAALIIQDEGTQIGVANTLNFIGSTITASMTNGVANITVNATQTDISALNAFTASAQAQLNALESVTGSFTTTASFNAFSTSLAIEINAIEGAYLTTASFNQFSSSVESRITILDGEVNSLQAKTGSYATTGSNTFFGNQTINGSINVTGDITASKLLVQIETASIIYSSGSNQFGDELTDTQTLWGNVIMTGSATINGFRVIDSSQTSSMSVASSSYARYSTDLYVYGRNTTAAILTRGQVVRITGATGDQPNFGLADWTDDLDSANTLGFVEQDIAVNGFGNVIVQGTLIGINTQTYTNGQLIYLGASGSITSSVPAPYHEVRLGQVLRVGNSNVGSVYATIDNGYELTELHDVDITNPITGNLLVYNSASLQWENKNQLTGSYGVTGSFNITGSFVVNGINFSQGTSGTSGQNGSSGTSGTGGSSGTSATAGSGGSSGSSGTGGSSGVSGTNGTAGSSGSSGSGGTSGVNGTSGTSGSSGSGGTSGVNGTNGTAGSSGTSSTAGSSGSSGTGGSSGSSGTGGTSGINGTNGTSGLNGSNGTSGSSGSSGTGGTSGVNGSNGTSGINGTNGTSGINGTNGTSGLDGTNGTAGSSGSSGTGGSSGLSGTNGTGGTSGINGTGGTSGINGTNGTSGLDGTNGTAGSSGSSGTGGTSGINGTSGSSGLSGTNGTGGTSGVNGTSGINGTSGTGGSSGLSGTNGTGGTSGINGTSGTSGLSGTNGTGGTSGVNGTSGINGTSGSSGTGGTSGLNGTSGINGTSGTTGTAGTSGTSATAGAGFPFTGSAQITGSLGITGSISFASFNYYSSGSLSGSFISNITDTNTDVAQARNVITLSSASYAALGTKDPNTIYLVSGSSLSGTSGTSGVGTNGTSGTSGAAGTSGTAGSSGTAGAYLPFTGSAQITGSVGITGSISFVNVENNYFKYGAFSGSFVSNATDTYTQIPRVNFITTLDSSSLGGLLSAGTTDPNTLYIVTGSRTGGFPFTGSAGISGSLTITGSSYSNVVSASIVASTASLDFVSASFFTCLVSGTTFFNVQNIKPGQTANLLLTTTAVATASFSSNVKQVSGSRYLPTSGSGRTDILTFITFDSTNVYLARIQNLV